MNLKPYLVSELPKVFKDPKHYPTAEKTLAVWKQPVNRFTKETSASLLPLSDCLENRYHYLIDKVQAESF